MFEKQDSGTPSGGGAKKKSAPNVNAFFDKLQKTSEWDNVEISDSRIARMLAAKQDTKMVKEIVHPLMYHLDYKRLKSLVSAELQALMIEKSRGNPNIMSDAAWVDAIRRCVPDHFIHDLYKLWLTNSASGAKILRSKNPLKGKILEAVVDPLLKIITDQNDVNSYFFTAETAKAILELVMAQNKEFSQKLGDGMNGDGDGDQEKLADDMMSMLGSEKAQRKLQEAMQKARERSMNAEQAGHAGFSLTGLADIERVEDTKKILDFAKMMSLSINSVSRFLDKIVDFAVSNFTQKDITVESSIFDTPVFEHLLDIEYLVPPIDRIKLLDTMVSNTIMHGTYDLYVDFSGSMGNDNTPNSRITIAKALSIKLIQLGIIEGVYFFDTRLSKKLTTPLEIVMYKMGGGTDFDVVTNNISITKKPSIIITDADGEVSSAYLKNALWVSVNESPESISRYFARNSFGKEYIANGQCAHYAHKTGSLTIMKP